MEEHNYSMFLYIIHFQRLKKKKTSLSIVAA